MMTPQQTQLYGKLLQWCPDNNESILPFSKRLARENGWKPAYTRRVIEEYKRFVFLTIHAGHPVTPSGPVDQAWHLHLTYTQSYWEDLCENILQRRLHHTPTKGGKKEGKKFGDQYQCTVQSYRSFFGEAPPADIWPLPGEQFAAARYQRWVDTRQYWVIPNPLRTPTGNNSLALVFLAAGLLLGCASANKAGAVWVQSMIGTFVLLGAVISYVRSARTRRRRSNNASPDSSSSGSGDNPGTVSMAAGATAAGFAGMDGGEFGGGGSGDSYGDAGGDGGDSGDAGDGGGDSGCSGGCGGGD